MFEQIKGPFKTLLVHGFGELELFEGILHLVEIHVLEGVLELLECLHQFRRSHLLDHFLQLVEHIHSLFGDHVILPHILRQLFHTLGHGIHGCLQILLTFLELLQETLFVESSFRVLEQFFLQFLKLLAGLVGLLEQLFDGLLGIILGLIEGFITLGQGWYAQLVDPCLCRLGATDTVIVPNLNVVVNDIPWDRIEAGHLLDIPIKGDFLVQLVGKGNGNVHLTERFGNSAETAFGEAIVQGHPRKTEVVRDVDQKRKIHFGTDVDKSLRGEQRSRR